MSRKLFNALGALLIVSVMVSCKKTEPPLPNPTPVPTSVPTAVASGTATCTVHALPAGTPPVCRDANANQVACPDNYKALPECP